MKLIKSPKKSLGQNFLIDKNIINKITRIVSIDSTKTIMEIGAGYGRTCHTILSNYDVQRYYILDLETCLNLSQKYLKTVLNEKNYSKIQFVPVADFPLLENVKFDISINIDSMSEMTSKIVYDYLLYIDKHSRLFFVKNPVGKYMLNDSSDDTPDQDAVSHALSTGILKDIIDIWDQKMVATKASKFVEAYQPGPEWSCIANDETIPWSYHWQALYKRI